MTSITLAGARLTDPGTESVYHGESGVCEDCPCCRQCLNLIKGIRYRIPDVRENMRVLGYAVYGEGVRTVEVEPTPVTANVPSEGTYAGGKASLQGPYPHTGCPSHEYYVPEGAEFGQEYRIHDVPGGPPHDHCHLDRNLTLVEFEPADE